MVRWLRRWSVLVSVSALAAGCGGLSTTEAQQRCDQERAADATGCITDAAYDLCVSCFEECGDECAHPLSCPATFTCPD